MIHSDSRASDSGAVRRQGRTIFDAKYKLLYSETALSGNPFAIEHMYRNSFMLTMTDIVTSQNTELSSLDTCIFCTVDRMLKINS